MLISTPHCRACCMAPERDHWRPLAKVEGAGRRVESGERRILSAYRRLLGRITLLGCAQAIRSPRQAT